MLTPNFDTIPQFLRDLPHWSVWPAIPRKNGKIGKPPLGINWKLNKPNDKNGWSDFNTIHKFYETNQGKTFSYTDKDGKHQGPISGVGILLDQSLSLVGIDFDNIIEPTGNYAEWATPLIKELSKITYCEISPSEKGIRAFIQGQKPAGKCRRGDLEIYDDVRFLTVTGHRLDGCQNEVGSGKDAQDILDKLIASITQENKPISTKRGAQPRAPDRPQGQPELMTDSELLDKIRQSKQGQKFSTLYDSGDISAYGNDHSAADQALCNILASWTGKDASRMDRLMRDSALLQEPERLAKWDKVHSQGATYGAMTIAKAIQDCRWCYEPTNYRKKSQSKPIQKQTNTGYFPLAEDDLAVRFVAKYKEKMRYCHDSGKWYQWNGQIWEKEKAEEAIDLMRLVCKEAAELAGTKERKGLLSVNLYKHALEIARTDRAVAVTSEIWDSNKFLLGTPNGTVDLKTGNLRKSIQTDYITKTTNVSPSNHKSLPLWMKFLDETTAGDKKLQRFIQQIAGMILTGDISEHALFFVYGPGGNGKSVFLTAITEIMQDYAVTAAMETFISSQSDHHPTDVAMLQGARLVTASETDEGRNWAESKIKQLTGGDKITARFMRQDYFTFSPQFKLLIIGNHKPSIRTLDEAIKRRINIIPFIQIPQEKDPHLSEKLRSEYPSILRWMIEGCLDWQQNGLQRPQCVKEATEDYFSDQDLFSQWINECCNVNPIFTGKSSELFASWKEFAEQNGIKPGNSKTFASDMEKRGYPKIRDNRGQKFKGICVKNDHIEEDIDH